MSAPLLAGPADLDAVPVGADAPLDKHAMAALVARNTPPGAYVNLGIGQPTLVAEHLPAATGVVLHTENGMTNRARSRTATTSTPTSPTPARCPSPSCRERRTSTAPTRP